MLAGNADFRKTGTAHGSRYRTAFAGGRNVDQANSQVAGTSRVPVRRPFGQTAGRQPRPVLLGVRFDR